MRRRAVDETARAWGRVSRYFSVRQYSSEREFVQEHDYTVKPTTYVYTRDANRELFEMFPMVTAKQLAKRRERPRRVRMPAREFIEDSMYNPHYGYFSQKAEIFTLKDKFAINEMGNIDSFLDHWALEYRKQQAKPGDAGTTQQRAAATQQRAAATQLANNNNVPPEEAKNLRRTRVSRQLWHTPSELFTPHYGEALARYILSDHNPEEELVIYETGAGNGTLMLDILNFLQREHPRVYARTQYHIIEISASLSLKQRAQAAGHAARVQIHNTSVLDWANVEPRKCFFICLEVWDNLAHDVVRYDNATNTPLQGYTVIEPNGDFREVFSAKLDPVVRDFLAARDALPDYKPRRELGVHPLQLPRQWRSLVNAVLPFQSNLSAPEYVPTRFFQLLRNLQQFFPQHRLLAADFTHFPGRTRGYCSPVVQTFMEDTPVTVSTYMVLQGYFDIMFPTDFELAKRLYEQVMQRPAKIASHKDFLREFADMKTKTRTGENPMLEFYKNAAFLTSV